ncbi:hypothetical protein [Archaeoglobus sp.]
MAKIKIKEVSDLETVKKMIAYKLSEKLGLGTLVLDPYGSQLLLILDTAEREFGKEAREELEEFLMPYHKVRVLQTLQEEGIRQKFWLVAPAVGAEPLERDEEDYNLSTSDDDKGLEPAIRETAKVDDVELVDQDIEDEEEVEDDDLLF